MQWKVVRHGREVVLPNGPNGFPVSYKGRPAVSLDLRYTDNLQYMDEGIRDILYRFNNLPGLETAWSCQGDYEPDDTHQGQAYIAFRREPPAPFIPLVYRMCPIIRVETAESLSGFGVTILRPLRKRGFTPDMLYQNNKLFATQLRAVLDVWERR